MTGDNVLCRGQKNSFQAMSTKLDVSIADICEKGTKLKAASN